MFGPNTYFNNLVQINYSHRDKIFFNLFSRVRKKFSEKFNLEDYDLLFIPGSGTVGIEAVMYSLKYNLNIIGHDGVFTQRWKDMQKGYSRPNRESINMFCLLETSASKYCNYNEGKCVVDAISGFPYYDIPSNAICFITCLNKQLGSYAGVAVVGVKKDCWDMFIEPDNMSYLNLSRYREAHKENQTPSTFPTYIFQHFEKVLDNFDLRDFRCKLDQMAINLVSAIGKDKIIGDLIGPVITVSKKDIDPELAREFELYGYYCPSRSNYQIFTYSTLMEYYIRFCNDLLDKIRGNRKIIAVDFDGTITEDSEYPITGKIREDAIRVLKELKKKYILVLWTCREGADLEEAVSLLTKHDLVFDYINSGSSSRKIYADYYIDDRALGATIDWKDIANSLGVECFW